MNGVKRMNEQKHKLNVGSGKWIIEGYKNLDVLFGDSLFPLKEAGASYGDSSVDEIRAAHVLEHFPHGQTQEILKHWVSKLKPGGVLKVAVPNFEQIARAYVKFRDGKTETCEANVEGYLMGGQVDEYDHHKALFDELGLRKMMQAAGLVNIRPWTSEIQDCAALPISLNLMGTKPAPDQPEQVDCKARTVVPDKIQLKIAAVMSVPRLTHTNNAASIFHMIARCGIPCQPGQGVFWHHALTRQIEDRIREGFDYLLAIDFDSWFLPGHVERLVQLLLATPEADALCAVQCQRERELPILGIHDEKGRPLCHLPRSWFEQPLTPIHIGHFGLSLFRANCFARIPKPWFRENPDPNGSWGEGRRDADVGFWANFEAAGCKLFMANEVNIGHLQEVCTFSGRPQDNWKPIHVYLRDLIAGQIPPHCDPAYRIGMDSPPPVKE